MGGLAIGRQLEDGENLTKYRRWEIVETYIDQSISTSDHIKKLATYLRMVQDYKAGLLDAIVCYGPRSPNPPALRAGRLDRPRQLT